MAAEVTFEKLKKEYNNLQFNFIGFYESGRTGGGGGQSAE